MNALMWRVGVDVPFGTSANAASIQLARTYFARRPYSVSAVDAAAFIVRR